MTTKEKQKKLLACWLVNVVCLQHIFMNLETFWPSWLQKLTTNMLRASRTTLGFDGKDSFLLPTMEVIYETEETMSEKKREKGE